MIRLIYSGSLPKAPSPERLASFAMEKHEQNKRHNLCGILVFIEQDFLQVIEGEEAYVDRHYSMVFGETNRFNLTLLARQHIEQRLFTDWRLEQVKPSTDSLMCEPVDQVLIECEHINQADLNAQHTIRVIHEFIGGKWRKHPQGTKTLINLH
jgi:hypothetical protein